MKQCTWTLLFSFLLFFLKQIPTTVLSSSAFWKKKKKKKPAVMVCELSIDFTWLILVVLATVLR